MEARESFVFHREYIDDLPEEYKPVFAMYAINYGIYGMEPELTGLETALWTKIKRRIDYDIREWESVRDSRSNAGKSHKGNQYTKKNKVEQVGTNGTEFQKMEQAGTSRDKVEQVGTNGTVSVNESVNVSVPAHSACACEATDFGSLQREAYALLEEHNASAPDGKKIPVSNSLISFSQKEARDLVAVVRDGSPPETVIPALRNYLSVAVRTDSWKTYFSWRDFIKNFVNFTPEYFSGDRFAAGRNTRAIDAVDRATVERVLPGQNNPLGIKYVQVINSVPQAFFPDGTLVFDYQNPRSDVRFAFYGYSPVEQAIDLVASTINTFNYNAGFFTENKLPRGMLLVDGNVSQEAVETMEDYICDMMSGPTSSQWHVPIIPSGVKDGSIKWVPLGGTNKEMEFQNWLDFLTSGVVALFGCSIDELGLHSQKSQPVFDHGKGPEIEESKGLVLGNTLGFLQQYVNKILALAIPGWEIEFVGYEKTDPQKLLDLAKGEVESYKTLNEVRKEKGLKPLASKWADECPANPQFMQMYQAENGGGQEGGMPGADGMDGPDGGMMESEPDEDGGDPWAGIGQPDEEDDEDGKKPSKGEEDYEAALLGDGKLGKSLPAVMSIRI